MQPRKYTWSKVFQIKGTLTKLEYNNNRVKIGSHGIKVLKGMKLNARSYEAGRRVIAKILQKQGAYYLKVFPNIPQTKKSIGTRMGKGHGSIDQWYAFVKAGTVIYELRVGDDALAKRIAEAVNHKIGSPTKLIYRI